MIEIWPQVNLLSQLVIDKFKNYSIETFKPEYEIHVDREDGEYVFDFELQNPKLNITPYSNLTIIWKSEP